MADNDIEVSSGIFDTKEKRRRALNAAFRSVPLALYPAPYNMNSAEDRAHVAGFYVSAVKSKVHAVYYAVELSLNENKIAGNTDDEIGLKDGIFRWITGTPNFDGGENDDSIMVDDDKKNTNKWYEGILIKDGMGNPSRKIDIKESGDYATLNGFNFSVRNDSRLWEKIDNRKLYIANSSVKVYAVLDNKFYSIWQGVIKSTAYTETEYIFKCETNFKVIHKQFPPQIVTEAVFPKVNEDAVGQVIPVCLGDVGYAKGLNISSDVQPFEVGEGNKKGSVFAAVNYNTNNSCLELKTGPDYVGNINANYLADKYLRVINGNGDDYYRIVKNDASNNNITRIYLDGLLEGWDINNSKYTGRPAQLSEKVWFFQILEFPSVRYIISQKAIKRRKNDLDVILRPEFFNYEDGYRSVYFAVRGDNFEGNDFDKDHPEFFTISEKAVAAKTEVEKGIALTAENPEQSILVSKRVGNEYIEFNSAVVSIDLTIPNDEDLNFDQLHLALDMDCFCFSPNNWEFTVSAFVKDCYGEFFGPDLLHKGNQIFSIKGQIPTSYHRMNMISNEYYKRSNNTYDLPSGDRGNLWQRSSPFNGQWLDAQSLTKLNHEEIKKTITSYDYRQKIRLKIIIKPTTDSVMPIETTAKVVLFIKEICFHTVDRNGKENWHRIDYNGISECFDNDRTEFRDKYRDKKREISCNNSSNSTDGSLTVNLDIDVPRGLANANVMGSNLCIDADFSCFADNNVNWILECKAYRFKRDDDNWNLEDDVDKDLFENGMVVDSIPSFPYQNHVYRFLPNIYYSPIPINRKPLWPEALPSEDSRFANVLSIKNISLLNAETFGLVKTGVLERDIRVKIEIKRNNTNTVISNDLAIMRLRQIGLVGVTKQEFKEKDVYVTNCRGEYFDNVESNSVYGAFYNILRRYDGIVGEDKINFTNLSTARNSSVWRVGRQIQEQKNSSFDYLKELCKQSFTGIVPSRKGGLILNAWLDQDPQRQIPYFDSDTIIRNSIKNFMRTEPQDLYNDFRINYAYNPGANKFDKCLFVTNSWEENFPSIDAPRDIWTTYACGMPFDDNDKVQIYNHSKYLWERCRESYRFVGKIQRIPESLSDLHWCVDDNYALTYLGKLIYWAARPKAQVEFSIPLNGHTETRGRNGLIYKRNIEFELLDKVFFKDLIYTANKNLTGYITKIEPDIKKGEIKIGVIFDPDDYSNIIIETGDSPLIIENGSRNDIIIERGT